MSSSPRSLRLVAVALLVLPVVAACGDADDEAADDTAASITTSSVSTTGGESTTTTPATTGITTSSASTTTGQSTTTGSSTTTSDACPAGPDLPADAADPVAITADLDLDSLEDDIRTYYVPGEGRWHIRVQWAGGGSSDQSIDDSAGVAPARPIGPYDVDGDGTLELFAVVGSGAATVLVGLYDVAGCELIRVTLDGEAASFPVGATVQHVSGLSCGPVGDLDRLFADYVADDSYEGGVEPFTLAGSELTAGFGDGATFTAEEAGSLAAFECRDLSL